MAACGAAPFFGSTASAHGAKSADDYYAKLGVPTIINAAGTYTYLTAALMPPQVQRAVAQAALHPVVLKDLQRASGEYIAKRLRCESALVTSGASAALTLATAACIQAANGITPERIPEDVPGLKNEVDRSEGASLRVRSRHAPLRCAHRRGHQPSTTTSAPSRRRPS